MHGSKKPPCHHPLWGTSVRVAGISVEGSQQYAYTLQEDGRDFQQLYEEELMTLELYQPQRFCPDVARMCAALEQQLGCPVSSSAYLTPAGRWSPPVCEAHNAAALQLLLTRCCFLFALFTVVLLFTVVDAWGQRPSAISCAGMVE